MISLFGAIRMGLQQTNPRGYSESVRRLMDKYGGSLSLIFVVLARNNLDTYAAVKQSTFVDYGSKPRISGHYI